MNYLTLLKKKLPYPLKRLYGRARGLFGDSRHLPNLWADKFATRLMSPEIQRRMPGLSTRLKILPSTKISLIVTCGNRLEYLKGSLPTYLAQSRSDYEVIVSIYADRQGCNEYVREHFGDYLRSGRLRLIETPAATFNKARAVNIAAKRSDADYLLLVDVDCFLNGNYAVEHMTRQFNLLLYQLASFSLWGQVLVQRRKFIEVGGYDATLGDNWAPDDFDFIARYIAYFRESYAFLAPTYTFIISPTLNGYQITRKLSKRAMWIIHKRERDPSFDHINFVETKFYKRIGGLKQSKEEAFEATLRYFDQHNPRIEFVA